MDDRLDCKKCSKKMVPRLWHYGGSSFSYMKTQHICPYCGAVQYESGGGLNRRAKVTLALLVAWLVLILFVSMGAPKTTAHKPVAKEQKVTSKTH
jgi:hypothetical protein